MRHSVVDEPVGGEPATGRHADLSDGVEPLASIDRAWLAMDQPDNPMVVSAVFELDGVRDPAGFGQLVAARLSRHARFRQCLDDQNVPRAWITLKQIDCNHHVQIRRLQGVRGFRGLRDAIGDELDKPLDRAFPLWRIVLFPTSTRKAVVLFRAHHALADGISLMRLLLKLMDADARSAPDSSPEESARRGPLGAAIDRLDQLNRTLIRAARWTHGWIDDPAVAGRPFGALADAAAALGHTLIRRDSRPSGLPRRLSGRRRLDWSDPLPLAPLRDRAHAMNLTLNDLLLGALAGALGRYLRGIGPIESSCNVQISIPVNLRRPDDDTLGNHFGLVLLDLPVGEPDADRRRAIVGERMHRLKHSMEAKAMLAGLAAVGHLPAFAAKYFVDLVASKACAVVSNLPGPDRALYLDRARLSRAIFLPPQTGDIGLGISILSYAGTVSIAVCSDTGVVADPDLVLRPFVEELKSLITTGDASRPRRPSRPRASLARGPATLPGVLSATA